MGRKSIASSLIGGIAETQEVIGPEDINNAFDRVVKKDVRYRFVIDMAKLKYREGPDSP